MCSLEEKIVSELLHSVLPLELARDIQADLTGQEGCVFLTVLSNWLGLFKQADLTS